MIKSKKLTVRITEEEHDILKKMEMESISDAVRFLIRQYNRYIEIETFGNKVVNAITARLELAMDAVAGIRR